MFLYWQLADNIELEDVISNLQSSITASREYSWGCFSLLRRQLLEGKRGNIYFGAIFQGRKCPTILDWVNENFNNIRITYQYRYGVYNNPFSGELANRTLLGVEITISQEYVTPHPYYLTAVLLRQALVGFGIRRGTYLPKKDFIKYSNILEDEEEALASFKVPQEVVLRLDSIEAMNNLKSSLTQTEIWEELCQ